MTKINVPQDAVALWRQVLQSSVTVPQWEVQRRDSDIRTLMDLDLVTVKTGRFPQYQVELTEPSLRLNEDQTKVLVGLSACGMSRGDFVEWARLVGIDNPLRVVKSLLDLDVIVLRTKDSLVSFFLR